jgi:hypothetical protein
MSQISRDMRIRAEQRAVLPDLTQEHTSQHFKISSAMSNTLSWNFSCPVPNNGTVPPISSPGSPSQLSWQSALWALIAIAVNTMTQSSPSSNSLFSDLLSLLRALLILCLADLLVMQMWLLTLTLVSRPRLSFLEAVRCLRKETGLERKEKRFSVLTIVLFVLGPLPQFIKLNACTGIPWALVWSWIFILCYFLTAISIVCDRGEGHPLLRAGMTLSLRTRALLRRISQRIYILSYSAQLVFSVWLIRMSFYTHAMHRFLGTLISIVYFSIMFISLPGWSMALIFGALTVVQKCYGFQGGVHGRWRLLFIFIFVSLLVANLYSMSPFRLSLLDPFQNQDGVVPFSVRAIVLLTTLILGSAWGGVLILLSLSETIGPNFEISLHTFPNRDLVSGTSIPPTSKSSRRPDTWAKTVNDPIFLASLQLFFALTMLVLALAYYWQIYVSSDTVKPDWVDVFG